MSWGFGPSQEGLRGDHQQQSTNINDIGNPSGTAPAGDDDRIARAKYLDWCSAQVADHFLELSPDEIFELAERAGRDDTIVPGRSSSAAGDDGLSDYRTLVARVTEVLTQQVELPTFEEWLELYRQNPEAIESRLLGLWREHI